MLNVSMRIIYNYTQDAGSRFSKQAEYLKIRSFGSLEPLFGLKKHCLFSFLAFTNYKITPHVFIFFPIFKKIVQEMVIGEKGIMFSLFCPPPPPPTRRASATPTHPSRLWPPSSVREPPTYAITPPSR